MVNGRKKCPRCGGLLTQQSGGYEDYLVCIMCARRFNFDMSPRGLKLKEFKAKHNIRYTHGREAHY